MPVTDPVAVRYSNEMLRPACDLLSAAIDKIDTILIDRRPDAKDLDALFPAGGGAVEDGAPGDGRTAVDADSVLALFRLCGVLQAMADDDTDPATGAHTGLTSRALLRKFAVNIYGPTR